MKRLVYIGLITFILLWGCSSRSPFEEAFSNAISHNALDESLLEGLNREQVRVIRNSIFASYGRAFNSIELNYLFYLGDTPIFGHAFYLSEDYSDLLLTETDKMNASLLLSLEQEKSIRFSQQDPELAFFIHTYSESVVECYRIEGIVDETDKDNYFEYTVYYLFEIPEHSDFDFLSMVGFENGNVREIIRNKPLATAYQTSRHYEILKGDFEDLPDFVTSSTYTLTLDQCISDLFNQNVAFLSGTYKIDDWK